ncbi:DUF4062 domain-containing protein [Dactylosporangium sp. NPDC049525]|uniref:DUF4062 domain-containing protein n=1 Tax=Dactylosporangium sp. NPDC049525 TaxID=3154730 RepID=UPI00343A4BFB
MRVFVSSTSRDLLDYRAAAIRSLRRLGHEVVAMEEFTAATTYPLDRVLKLVRGSDAYVLLVAWRYGFIPDSAAVADLPKVDGDPLRSITEWEYAAAKEDEQRPILVFLLSETAPWPPQQMDGFGPLTPGDEASLDRVRAFRASLMRERVVSFFSRPDELEALVGAAVTSARLSRGVLINRLSTSDPIQGDMMSPDSSVAGEMIRVVSGAGPHRVITIDIATDWWSTRLYLLAFLLDRLSRAQRIMVVDAGRFVGLLSLSTVTRVIASLHPQLQQFRHAERLRTATEPDITREAEALVALFVEILGDEYAVKVDVTAANLGRWFEDSIVTSPIRVYNIDRVSPLDLIRLFDYPGDFVPVIVGKGDQHTEQERSHVIDKPALSLQLAQAYVTDLLEESLH